MKTLPPLLLSICLLAACPVCAPASESKSLRDRQVEYEREIPVYDFEIRDNPVTSQDVNRDGVPDYWHCTSGPAYLADKVAIVPDPLRPSTQPGLPNTVLRIPFSGEKEGMVVESAVPRSIDSQLAYEVSFLARTERLDNSDVSLDIIWLRQDEEGRVEALGEPERIEVPRGQVDWPEAPLRRRMNSLPPQANRVRFAFRIQNSPDTARPDRIGAAYFDNVRIQSRPKINFTSACREDHAPLQINIQYQGLIDNVADPEKNSGLRKKYFRRLEIRDIEGHRLEPELARLHLLEPGAAINLEESVSPALPAYGIYYIQASLFGANDEMLATVTETAWRWRPAMPKLPDPGKSAAADRIGISFDVLPRNNPFSDEELANFLSHLGVLRGRVGLWGGPGEEVAADDLAKAAELLRRLRNLGLRFTCEINALPGDMANDGENGMFDVMQGRMSHLDQAVRPQLAKVGGHIEEWQWGKAGDQSFVRNFAPETLAPARKLLSNLSNAFTQVLPIPLGKRSSLPPVEAAEAVLIHVQPEFNHTRMVEEIVRSMPERLAWLGLAERAIYPSQAIQSMIDSRRLELDALRIRDWDAVLRRPQLDIGVQSADSYQRKPSTERAQAIDLSRKMVLALAFGFQRIYAGSLADPESGLVVAGRGQPSPRPSFLAVRTLTENLAGASYVGSYQLGPTIENYIFATGSNQAIIALWTVGQSQYENVELGKGGRLREIDMAGNEAMLPEEAVVRAGRMPKLVTGIILPLARTRMSLRILEDPPLYSMFRQQPQRIYIRNFFEKDYLSGTIMFTYAARELPMPATLVDDGAISPELHMERGWLTQPARLEINLPPGGDTEATRVEGKFPYEVRPTHEATIGAKYAQLDARLVADGAYSFKQLRPTELKSDISLTLDPNGLEGRSMVLRFLVGWSPAPNLPAPASLRLVPYYQIEGKLPVRARPIVVEPDPEGRRTSTRDVPIPFPPPDARVYAGVEEDGGTRFILKDVTELFRIAREQMNSK